MTTAIAQFHSEILRYLAVTLLCSGLLFFSASQVKINNFSSLLR